MLVLLLRWLVKKGGFPRDQYQYLVVVAWHAVFMTLFAVVFTNEAMLSFVAPVLPSIHAQPTYKAYLHAACHVLALACMVVGMTAIVGSKQRGPDEYLSWAMWSAHSWLGAFALACWGVQLSGTLALRLWRARVAPSAAHQRPLTALHRFFGQAVYALLLTSCLTGLQSRQSSDLSVVLDPPTDSQLPAGLSVLLTALGVSTYAALAYLPPTSGGEGRV